MRVLFGLKPPHFSPHLFLHLLGLWLALAVAACRGETTAPPLTTTPTLAPGSLAGQPVATVWPALDQETQDFIDFFTPTVPVTIPPLAFATFNGLNPRASVPLSGPLIITRTNGVASLEVGIGNFGSTLHQPNVLCLKNQAQVSCTPEVGVWQITLPPQTMVLAPIHIAAAPGDRLVFLTMPQDEPQRPMQTSKVKWAFVEQLPDALLHWVDGAEHQKVFGGCNFGIIIKDPYSYNDPANKHFVGVSLPFGTPLYLLLQLCHPTGNEYVQLVPVANRLTVVNLPGELWHSPVHLTSENTLIPIDTSQLDPSVEEFQIGIIPLSDEAAEAFHRPSFTQAITFSK